jgi:hypothetical protein
MELLRMVRDDEIKLIDDFKLCQKLIGHGEQPSEQPSPVTHPFGLSKAC